jgi:hypothetical protein
VNEQPEALVIAVHPGTSDAARDQLIRQHALIEELRGALEDVLDALGALGKPHELTSIMGEDADKVFAALAKAEPK